MCGGAGWNIDNESFAEFNIADAPESLYETVCEQAGYKQREQETGDGVLVHVQEIRVKRCRYHDTHILAGLNNVNDTFRSIKVSWKVTYLMPCINAQNLKTSHLRNT